MEYVITVSDSDLVQLLVSAQPHDLRLGRVQSSDAVDRLAFIQSLMSAMHAVRRTTAAVALLAGVLTYTWLSSAYMYRWSR